MAAVRASEDSNRDMAPLFPSTARSVNANYGEDGAAGKSVWSFPDRLTGAGEAEFGPLLGDGFHHVVAHADFSAPFTLSLGRPFVGGVKPDLGAQARFRRSKVQIIDRRVLDHRNVARR